MKKLKIFILFMMTSFLSFAQPCDVTIQVDETPMGTILTANGTGTGTYSFIWSNNQTGSSIVVTPNGTVNDYCVDLITSDSCFASACVSLIGGNDCSVSISQSPNTPILTANPTGTAPFSYSWSDGTVGQTTQVNFLIQEYCVTVTDADGCVAEDCINIGGGNDCEVDIVLNPSGALFASGSGTGNISYLWSTGDMTSTIFPTSTGDYCVTTTDSNGCTADDCYFYSVDSMDCDVTIIVDSLNTGGANGYVLTANPIGDGPFNYFWDNNQTTQSIEVFEDGEYCVTIEGPNNCLATTCVTVGGNANCAVVINEGFFGGLTAVGSGMGSYSFVWSTGATTQNIFPLTSGEYCVTATDANGCFATDCYFYNIPGGQDSCSVEINVVQNGSWLQAVAGGVAPFTYSWNTGETTAAIPINPNQVIYCVEITDATGCIISNCININGTGCNVFIQLNALGDLAALSNDFGPFTYEWNTGEITQTITPDGTGDYCVTLTDDTGCTSSDCYFFSDSLCTAYMLGNPVMGTMDLELSVNASGVAPFTYSWDTGDTSPTIIISSSGTYCVTVTDAEGCAAGTCGTFVIQTPNFNVSGIVHQADSTILNVPLEGLAYLYLMDVNGDPVLIDSVDLVSTPIGGTTYDFGDVAAGDYIVKVALSPNSPLYEVSLPTYHWETEFWQDASIISVPYFGSVSYNVHMIYGEIPDGDGLINGGVFVFDGMPNAPFEPKSGDNPTKNLGDPISNISILLFDEFEEPLGHTVTDGAGEFSFPNLAWGTYKVWVEITGKEQAFYWVTIGPDNPEATGLFFEVDNDEVTTNLQEIIAEEGIKVFPNPATTSVNILLNVKQNATIQLMLTSVTGQTLQSNNQEVTKGQQLINLNIDHIPSGIYFLNISDGKEIISKRLVVSK